jgi:hypothetical protein
LSIRVRSECFSAQMNSSRQIIGSDLAALLDGSVTTTLDG